MYFLLFVFIFFTLLTIWWFEVKYSYFHDIWIGIKKVCPWVDTQTKFKLAICKVFSISLVLTLIICIWNVFYEPYFDQYLSFDNWKVELVDGKNDLEDNPKLSSVVTEVNSEGFQPLKIEIVNEDSQIGDWGTFGDFIGGTLNPIIGFISILLLFATWKLTRKTLDFTKQELRNSNQLLVSQQFDSLFFSVLEQLKDYEKILTEKDKEGVSTLDQIYYDIFYKKLDYILSYKRELLKGNEYLNQYFICLFQLYKMINNIFEVDAKNYLLEREETFSLEKKYSNILRSIVPTKLQQLLFLNISEEFELYKDYLNYYSFFKHMSFSRLDNRKGLNVDVIALAENFKKSYKDDSKKFLMLSESIYYAKLKESIFFNLKENDKSFLNGFDLIRGKLKKIRKITVFYSNESRLNEIRSKYDYLFITFDKSMVLFSKKDVFTSNLENDNSYHSKISYADIFYDFKGIGLEVDSIKYFIHFQKDKIVKVEKIREENSRKISTAKLLEEIILDQNHSFIHVEKNPL